MIEKEFDNMQFVWKMTKNTGRFRVPLACLVEYRGFIVIVKVNVKSNVRPDERMNLAADL